jgi:hypothetical protein
MSSKVSLSYFKIIYIWPELFFHKSDSVFKNGHFKNVQNGKPKKSFEKVPLKTGVRP